MALIKKLAYIKLRLLLKNLTTVDLQFRLHQKSEYIDCSKNQQSELFGTKSIKHWGLKVEQNPSSRRNRGLEDAHVLSIGVVGV
jgi:hypothetical protein